MRSRHERAIGVACFLFALAGGSALLRAPAAPSPSRAPASAPADAFNPDQPDDQVPIQCLRKDDILKRGCARYAFLDGKCAETETYAAIAGSCFYEKESELIPEIQDLSNREFPPGLLDRYDLNQIARNLVYRIYRLREAKHVSAEDFLSSDYSFYHRLDLQIAFDSDRLDRIAREGFLNQHQTRTSHGTNDPYRRQRAESEMVEMDLDAAYRSNEKVKNLLPKYLFATPSSEAPGLHRQYYQTNYGNVLAVLDDDVRGRMTFTSDDSLGLAGEGREHSLKWIRNPRQELRGSRYFEGQIWGTVGLVNVKYFVVNCPNLKATDRHVITRLNEVTGIPVYGCKSHRVNGGPYYRADGLLAGEERPGRAPLPAPDR